MPITITSPGPLGSIAAGIQDRLKLVFPESKFTHEFVPARVTPESWKRLMRRPPFVGVGWAAFNAKNSTRQLDGATTWIVYLATVNQTGTRERYLGDKLAAGLLDMIGVASAALHGFDINGVGSIEVEKAESAFIDGYEDENQAMAAIDLQIRTSLPLSGVISGVEVNDLTLQDVQWSFNDSETVALRDAVPGVS